MKTVVLLTLLFLTSCVTNHPFINQYKVKPFTLYIADWNTVKTEYQKAQSSNTNGPIIMSRWGFCDPSNRIMWVMGYEHYPPTLDSLGRCIWYLPELGGPSFHED